MRGCYLCSHLMKGRRGARRGDGHASHLHRVRGPQLRLDDGGALTLGDDHSLSQCRYHHPALIAQGEGDGGGSASMRGVKIFDLS